MAEVVLRRMAAERTLADGSILGDRLVVTSAGTGNWHAGEGMDPRARDALAARGSDGDGHVARQFRAAWLDEEDLVVCLDRSHHRTVAGLGRGRAGDDRHEPSIVLLRSFDPRAAGAPDVDDPYYGDEADFARCLREVEAACRGLADHLVAALDREHPDREADGDAQAGKVTNDSAS
jgi:protein-tyrosine phosphatase